MRRRASPRSFPWTRRPFYVLAFSAWCLLASGCGTESGQDVFQSFEEGRFLPRWNVAQTTGFDPTQGTDPSQGSLPLPAFVEEGWGAATFLGWRPVGDVASLKVQRRSAELSELLVAFRRLETEGAAMERTKVEVRFEDTILGSFELGTGRREHLLAVPPTAAVGNGRLEFRFEPRLDQPKVGRPWIVLERVGFLRPGEKPPGRRQIPSHSLDEERRTLEIPEPGEFLWPFQVPSGGGELSFRTDLPADEVLIATAVDLDGQRHELGQWERSSRITLDLSPFAERTIFLSLEKTSSSGPASIIEPRFSSAAPTTVAAKAAEDTSESSEAASVPAESQPTANPPDILLILLDAARGDRFLDYHRPVIPNISEFAQDALVFRRAYSECPSTVCSIPNLVTGLPFLPLGSPRRPKKVDDGVVTLAESLRDLGYKTVAISGNPYNSRSRGVHQGFEEFHEMWRKRTHVLVNRAIEVLETESDRPLFLFLHLVPPHEPYAPGPEFDLFGDPDYSGPVNPKFPLRPMRRGDFEIGPDDIEELIALYDGNLLLGDAAVGQVFEAAKRSGRYDHSLTLLVSDHGEAFFEHGRQGHNSTVYEEMLHIPFILRLPGGEIPPKVDLDRLVNLSDVVPTVLGQLGQAPAPGVDGIDLLHTPTDPERVIYHRVPIETSPSWSARTWRYKSIARPHMRQQELFDLESDPGERKNLLLDQPQLFAGLHQLLRHHRARAEAAGIQAEDSEFTEEEKETLRSLGYLD